MKPVMNLLQDPNWLNVDGGAAYGEYKGVAAESGGVIGTLKSIRSTLMDQKQASIEKENESRRQYEVAKGAKEAELKKSKDEKAEKENDSRVAMRNQEQAATQAALDALQEVTATAGR